MGTDGEGIGHLEDSDALSGNGYTLFVKDAVLGDTVRAKVVKPKKGYAFCASGRSAGTVARPRGAGLCVCETVWRLSAAGGFL